MQNNERERNLALNYLYDQSGLYNLVYSIVVKNSNGNEEDARDVYNESFCALSRHLVSGRFRGDCKLSTYFYRIALRTWMHYRDKKERDARRGVEEWPDEEYDPNETYYASQERRAALDLAMEKLGRRSQQILKLWANDFSMKEIARIIELGSSDRAKKETQRSKARLRKVAEDNPVLGEQLMMAFQ